MWNESLEESSHRGIMWRLDVEIRAALASLLDDSHFCD